MWYLFIVRMLHYLNKKKSLSWGQFISWNSSRLSEHYIEQVELA